MTDVPQELMDLMTMMDEPLTDELKPYLEPGEDNNWPMLRHPLVYQVPFHNPGLANKALAYKKEALANAIEQDKWHTIVFLHERPYRVEALIKYVVGTDELGEPTPLAELPDDQREKIIDLAANVWVDSENIRQNVDEWTALFTSLVEQSVFFGDAEEKAEFDALPDEITVYRGGGPDSAWSWTTDKKTAEFFSCRSGNPVRSRTIRKSEAFGYLTRRGEYELLSWVSEE